VKYTQKDFPSHIHQTAGSKTQRKNHFSKL